MKKKFGIIGNPIRHSLSPVLHNYWFDKYSLDANYSIIEATDKDLTQIISKIKNRSLNGINITLPFKQRIIKFDDDSNALLDSLAYKLVDQQNALEKEGLEVLLSRTREKAMRLALIGALADDRKTKTIKGDITQWAIDYVYYYDQLLIENCKDKVAGSEMEGRIKQILSFIRSQGDWGISKRDIDRREIFRSMKSYEVKEIIERLKNSGEIQEKDLRAKGTGRPTKRIVAIDPEFFNED